MTPYFIWNGHDSREYGIVVSEYPSIIRPKERVTEVTIPGRSGTLTIPEGDQPVFETMLRSCKCWIKPGADIERICAWLHGSGSVVFGNEPQRAYRARITNQIDFLTVLRGREQRAFAIPFLCQPFKLLYPPADEFELTTSGMKITNPGTAPAWPKITVYGNGTITLITYSGAVVLHNIERGIVLDWAAQECMSLDGGRLLNEKVEGEPQYLPPGESTITWTGGNVTRVMITPNWCFI